MNLNNFLMYLGLRKIESSYQIAKMYALARKQFPRILLRPNVCLLFRRIRRKQMIVNLFSVQRSLFDNVLCIKM